ncbi:hypothetical protein ACA910_015826 [Epithemia clementina (nom. ined.)]
MWGCPQPSKQGRCVLTIELEKTNRFSVLSGAALPNSNKDSRSDCRSVNSHSKCPLPCFHLHQILNCHGQLLNKNNDRQNEEVSSMAQDLYFTLSEHGGFLMSCSPNSNPGRILTRLQRHVQGSDLFPNHAQNMTSKMIYVSERDVPMYCLGYERTEDGIREIVRLAAGLDPDEVNFLSSEQRSLWLQSVALLRHITDAVLDLLLLWHRQQRKGLCDNQMHVSSLSPPSQIQIVTRQSRPYSNVSSWCKANKDRTPYYELPPGSIRDRTGDFSVFYAMHYFNETALISESQESSTSEVGRNRIDSTPLAVKAHVDPSLCVVEPFLCPSSRGLQIWHRGQWLDCDGPESPLHDKQLLWRDQNSLVSRSDADSDNDDECRLLLFAGKALQEAVELPAATLHRVVKGTGPRKTVIYEQKYAEFFEQPQQQEQH